MLFSLIIFVIGCGKNDNVTESDVTAHFGEAAEEMTSLINVTTMPDMTDEPLTILPIRKFEINEKDIVMIPGSYLF